MPAELPAFRTVPLPVRPPLYEDLRNAVRFGIPEAEAIRAATIVPARRIGAEREVGSIEPGKFADFAVCGDGLALRQVYLGGAPV